MKALFIFPPTWSTFSVSTGIPQIMGYLIENGYENVQALDLNVKFHQYFYKKSRFKTLYNTIKEERNRLYKEIFFEKTGDLRSYNMKKSMFLKYDLYLKNNNNLKKIEKVLSNIEKFSKRKSINSLCQYSNDIMKANNLISTILYYVPQNQYSTEINTKTDKILNDYFDPIVDEILKNNYDYIGFSVNQPIQSSTAHAIIKMLRTKGYNGHINIGGTNVEADKNIIKNSPNFFKGFINSAMIGAGELPTKELFEVIEGKRRIEDVSSLIYLDRNGNVVENSVKNEYISDFIKSSYNGYIFDEYTTLETVLPIRTSTGCYWGKCTFCNYNSLTKYKSRTVDDVISEIKNIIKRQKVNNFYFVDAALSPKFLDEFSGKIIEENIEIYYFTNLRFEEVYTKEFLEQLFKSGLRCAGWGLESASPRILKLMNKGTNIETVQRILNDAGKLGIFNHLYFINAFPTETIEDFDMTINFILKNKELISSIADHYFHLEMDSYMYSHIADFGLNESRIKKIEECKKGISSFSAQDLGLKIDFKYYDKRLEEVKNEIQTTHKNIGDTFETLLLHGKYLSLNKSKNNFWKKIFK